ncbi:MAG: glycoside hydrolase family 5 protein, partial [Planctomycetota bacterium]
LDRGYDLSGVAKDFALRERAGGNGIMYSSHIYPWKSDWQGHTLAAAEKYPVFVGEVGCPPDYSGFQFIPPAQRYPLEGWPEDALALLQKHKLHWTGFSFHPRCGPMVILDWNYTPTPYWGVFVKDALAGKQFELKKMR